MNDTLLLYCRAGFEPELAAELAERAADAGVPGHARAVRGQAHVLFAAGAPDAPPGALSRALPFDRLVFARQKLELLADLRGLPVRDRLTPVLQTLAALPPADGARTAQPPFGTLWMEHPDSDAGRPLAGLARSFGNALRPALRRAGLLAGRDLPGARRLHACFLAGDHLLLAASDPADSAPWPLGIPRLRLHPDAPSRSALKLEEALLVLLDDAGRRRLLQPGMRAADLGAAPGGWTWVLARHHLRVVAVDNGPLRPALLDTGLVEHLRADGFTWRPPQPLDWLVCDMVEQPRRVAARIATWLREDWCRQALFNLKLPMRRRWDEVRLCLDLLQREAGRPLRLRARQLYHDREEITVLACRASQRASLPAESFTWACPRLDGGFTRARLASAAQQCGAQPMSPSSKSVLTLALLAALGASGTLFAQVEAPRPQAVEEAEESRDEAVEAAERAKLDAEAAARAARTARAVSDSVPAATFEGELAARANAQVATEAARDAERAAREAERASRAARSGLNAARVGSDPPRAALEAEQAVRATRAAGGAAAQSAARAEMAADAALDAVSPPPALPPPASPVAVAATQQVTVNSMPNDPIRSNFLATDADGNGSIDRSEAAADAGLAAQFDRFDADGDGRLSLAEYKAWRDWR